jgi:NADP-dependent 3-hydroxy acid dehydrogenase YdfG
MRAVATRASSGRGLAACEALAAECVALVTFSRSGEHLSKTKSLAECHMAVANHSRAI